MRGVVTLLLVCLSLAPAVGADWPDIRGENFDGHSTDTRLIGGWPVDGPPVLWTRPLGQGYSAITGRGDRVYTQYQTLGGQYAICLNAATGETVWESRYGLAYEPAGLYPGPRSTPTLSSDRLFVSTPDGRVICLHAETGRRIWKVDLFETFDAEPVEFGYSCSPTVIDGKVIMPVGGDGSSLVALSVESGEVVWQGGSQPASHVPAFPIDLNGRKLVVAYLRNSLALFDRETGEPLAEVDLSTGYDEHAAWPIYHEPYLWTSGPFRAGSRLWEITADDPPRFKTVWRSSLLSNDVCSSVLVDGHIYGFDLQDVQSKVHRPSRGTFRCLEFATGEEKWSHGTPNERRRLSDAEPSKLHDSIGHASVVHADGKLILFNDTGELLLVQATPEKFQPLARMRVLGGAIVWTSPTLIDQRLYLRNHSRAVCIDLGKPQQTGDAPPPRLRVADIPQENYRDWAAMLLPIEPEYAMDAPSQAWLTNWFWVSLVLGWVMAPLLSVLTLLRRRWWTWSHFRSRQRGFAILLGLLGTTLLSGWQQEFLFTWPLSLAVLFEVVVYQLRWSHTDTTSSAARARLALLSLVALSVVYYLVCLRLSLAFEWVFLMSFPAALPLLLIARWCSFRSRPLSRACEFLLSAAAYAAFHWSAAAILFMKY